LVERVQGAPGEDFAVIMCGYEKEMRSMFRDCNPGLSRRFRIDDPLLFADYNDADLTAIMVARATALDLTVSHDVAASAVRHVLAKQRAQPNFGNAGAVDNLLRAALQKAHLRTDAKKVNGRLELIANDLFRPPVQGAARAKLSSLANVDSVLVEIDRIEKLVTKANRTGSDPSAVLKNYVFAGPPGTGKTTVARAFGEAFFDLGLLASSAVVERKVWCVCVCVCVCVGWRRRFEGCDTFHLILCPGWRPHSFFCGPNRAVGHCCDVGGAGRRAFHRRSIRLTQ
jgi:hypothetical protein